jgi:sec-independent protein translocase protein TatB
MLDFGWQEFMVIAVVAVLVVGPKELPRVFRTISGLMRKARSLAGEFHSAMDEMAREADLQDIKSEMTKVKNGSSDWVKDIDPTGEVSKSMNDAKAQVNSAKDAINKSARPNFPTPSPTSSPSPTTPKPAVTPDPDPTAVTKTANVDAAPKTSPAAPVPKKAAAKEASTKAPAGKKTVAKKTAAKTTSAKTTGVKKAVAKKTAAKKAVAKKTGDTA